MPLVVVGQALDNNLFGPDVVAYDVADDGSAPFSAVVIDSDQVFTPEFAFVQVTLSPGPGPVSYASSVAPGTGLVTVSNVNAGPFPSTARIFIGRWPRPQNRS